MIDQATVFGLLHMCALRLFDKMLAETTTIGGKKAVWCCEHCEARQLKPYCWDIFYKPIDDKDCYMSATSSHQQGNLRRGNNFMVN